jgi:hypothetical protein
MSDKKGGFASEMLSGESADDESQRIMHVQPEGFAKVNSNKVKLLNIFDLYPDPVQPRRSIPKSIRHDWLPIPGEMAGLFDHWQQVTGIDPAAYMSIESAVERPASDDPAAVAFMALVDLAGSIHRDKLANPVTVVKASPDRYTLETGERRWMAYHLLYTLFGDTYLTIPAREMPALDIWRQAAENNARADLTAIARARQLALLLMVVQGDTVTFKPRDEFAHELDYYAQVADGDTVRIPKGATERIVTAAGMKSKSQMRAYRALLRLPAPVWDAADDRAIPESVLRAMWSQTHDVDELMKLVEDYHPDSVSIETLSPEKVKPTSPAVTVPGSTEVAKVKYLRKISRKTLNLNEDAIHELSEKGRAEHLGYIELMRDKLAEIERLLKG